MNICIGCGLCCDGSLHALVKLDQSDDHAGLELRGIPLIDIGKTKGFSQPCPKLECGSCTVYEDRPSACRRYRCKLLKRYDAGDVAAPEALAIILRVKSLELQTVLRPALEAVAKVEGSSISSLLRRAHKEIADAEDPAEMRRRHSALLLHAKGAMLFVIKNFVDRPPNRAAIDRAKSVSVAVRSTGSSL